MALAVVKKEISYEEILRTSHLNNVWYGIVKRELGWGHNISHPTVSISGLYVGQRGEMIWHPLPLSESPYKWIGTEPQNPTTVFLVIRPCSHDTIPN